MVANIFNIIFVMSRMSHLDPDGREVRRGLGMPKHQRNHESRQGSRIKLTNAELCRCWIDRVALAKMRFDRGDMKVRQRAIGGAKRYAI
jgi:hypothetical protein